MRAIIIIFIIQAVYINISLAQHDFDDKLLILEKEIFSNSQAVERNSLLEEKFMLYLREEKFSLEALQQARRVEYRMLSDSSLQRRYLWNTALLSQMVGEHNVSRQYYNLYQHLFPDTSIQSLLLRFYIYSAYDTIVVKEIMQDLKQRDSRFETLNCYTRLLAYAKKKEKLYVISSAVLPGSGNLMMGNISRGVGSLALNTASGLLMYYLISSNMYVNAVFWATGFGLKFYAGNIRLTEVSFQEREMKKRGQLAQECEQHFQVLLKDFHLEFME
jgi:hypothetical protein